MKMRSSRIFTSVAAVLAMVFLGEALHLYHLGGAALILSGIALATLRKKG